VARVSALLFLTLWRSLLLPVSLLLLTCLMLLVSPTVLAPLLLLASSAVLDISYAAVRPAAVESSLDSLPWLESLLLLPSLLLFSYLIPRILSIG
jgi:hypothetical protein